ncbi:hypothetical protein K474DRAFT_1666609 [Panus rudis PR-1116 ss-1]|nr:hypothetical protein K474DRAFT_1666609 [Panus rudis PR-1116 ss-1]
MYFKSTVTLLALLAVVNGYPTGIRADDPSASRLPSLGWEGEPGPIRNHIRIGTVVHPSETTNVARRDVEELLARDASPGVLSSSGYHGPIAINVQQMIQKQLQQEFLSQQSQQKKKPNGSDQQKPSVQETKELSARADNDTQSHVDPVQERLQQLEKIWAEERKNPSPFQPQQPKKRDMEELLVRAEESGALNLGPFFRGLTHGLDVGTNFIPSGNDEQQPSKRQTEEPLAHAVDKLGLSHGPISINMQQVMQQKLFQNALQNQQQKRELGELLARAADKIGPSVAINFQQLWDQEQSRKFHQELQRREINELLARAGLSGLNSVTGGGVGPIAINYQQLWQKQMSQDLQKQNVH